MTEEEREVLLIKEAEKIGDKLIEQKAVFLPSDCCSGCMQELKSVAAVVFTKLDKPLTIEGMDYEKAASYVCQTCRSGDMSYEQIICNLRRMLLEFNSTVL